MTDKMREAFEEWYVPCLGNEADVNLHKANLFYVWQAATSSIIAKLDSPEMVVKVALEMVNASREAKGFPSVASFDGFMKADADAYSTEAKVAIEAIKQELDIN